MTSSSISCALGVLFVLAIAILHATGFERFTNEMNQTDASTMMKDMFPVLYLMPSLYLAALAAFGVLAMLDRRSRRSICLILAPAVLLAGALALLLGEWLPLVVMGVGAGFFALAALMKTQQNGGDAAQPD